MTPSTSWQPLVSGELAGRLRASLAEILAAVNAPSPHHEDPWTALLYHYADRVCRSDEHSETVDRILERAITTLAEDVRRPALYGGFSGVAWLLTHVTAVEPDDEDANEDIDAALRTVLARSPWPGHYDLVSGLVGIGVYFLERLEGPSGASVAAACLELIVERLAELATYSSAGAAWLTPPAHLPEWQREQAPQGHHDFGVAHGIAGIIALLGQLCEANVGGERAKELLGRGVDWLLAQPPTQGRSRFPGWRAGTDDPETTGGARVAWCYGDLGLSTALLRAARCVGESRWEREAIEIARNEATRLGDDAMARDAGLCHGTAGIAHVFNRLFQATGDASFEAAARHWLERTLEMRHPGAGIAGYRACMPNREHSRWEDEPGFLTGAAGVGLALLAATSDVEPAWDRLLLVSVPARTKQ